MLYIEGAEQTYSSDVACGLLGILFILRTTSITGGHLLSMQFTTYYLSCLTVKVAQSHTSVEVPGSVNVIEGSKVVYA